MAGVRRKGQSFILGSVIFSLLVTLVFLTTGPTVRDTGTSTQAFFSQTLAESSHAFNNALEQNSSATYIRRRMQSYDRFVERQALVRGIDYSTYSLVVSPDRGEAAFFNMHPTALDISLRVNGNWENRTVAANQGFTTRFSQGTASLYLEVHGRNETYSLDAATPKLVKHSVMASSDETWANTLVG